MLTKFKALLNHLNAGEDEMAAEFAVELEALCTKAEEDAHWRGCLEAAGVDNWCGYDEAFDEED